MPQLTWRDFVEAVDKELIKNGITENHKVNIHFIDITGYDTPIIKVTNQPNCCDVTIY